jgi:lysophospholipase L1-like esterase
VDGKYRTFAGTWNAGRPTAEAPAWVAIDVGRGPSRLLLVWSASGSYNYDETDYGSPGSYRVETSADSTTGSDGSWSTVAHAEGVSTHAGEHAFDFRGARWVRFVVTGVPPTSPNGVQIDEIALHDVSQGSDDTWFFMGDSITAFVFDRATPAHQPGFAERIHALAPAYDPAIINGGIGGDKSDDGVRRIDAWLTSCPDMKHWVLAYGTNDAAGNAEDVSRFRANMATLVARVRSAGREPVLGEIPFASDGQHGGIPRFNQVLAELREASAPLTPPLYAWFSSHPDELRDGVHPNDAGIVSINRLWADAMRPLYRR